MTNWTFTDTYLVGRKIVPFVTAPAKQNHSDRRRTGDQHMRKGLIALTAHFYLARHPSKTSRRETSFAAAARKPATHREARCSNELFEHLEHLRETKDLFDHLALI